MSKKYTARIEVVLDKEFDFNAKDLTEAYREAGKIVGSTQWKNFFLSFNLKNVTVTRVNEEEGVLKEK
ncbi:hypothetical protein CMI37_31940 [Candidatus Pacearchaeota archaeon]|nr:hypothetical protein [Candidatus Pacearchaeota archaeon]|tara:strand:- start:2290 stop:2493 length:204 start_codon:yes stop_codon:yes gene_type:complete